MMPKHWKIMLEGHGESDGGDVITVDGEIIGTWKLVEDVFHIFTPNGEKDYIFYDPFAGSLCEKVFEWHKHSESSETV